MKYTQIVVDSNDLGDIQVFKHAVINLIKKSLFNGLPLVKIIASRNLIGYILKQIGLAKNVTSTNDLEKIQLKWFL